MRVSGCKVHPAVGSSGLRLPPHLHGCKPHKFVNVNRRLISRCGSVNVAAARDCGSSASCTEADKRI
ncbi:hypothetical protein F2P81_018143 [Scophthalmus maximus]|uniref:Uncharacterized protein n=1 Tax=Scophthalmus maximus TaxID=52904 RepID=A0A6A4S9V5_SCOMX|nr:hypothetical protein F2P81_018143 [Scophthalmus maximus]